MLKNLIFAFAFLLCLSISSFSSGQSNSTTHQFDEKLYQTLKYRNIGPFRGGRSTTITGVPGDIFTYYQGATGGGRMENHRWGYQLAEYFGWVF